MGVIASWFTARSDAAYFKQRCEELEERLFDEIDSNRLREDELKNAFLKLAGAEAAQNTRTSLAAPTRKPDGPQDEEEEEQPAVSKVLVDGRIAEYVRAAAERGDLYSDEQIAELRAEIVADPAKFHL